MPLSDAAALAIRPHTLQREWLATCHCADPVPRLLDAEGWSIVDDPYANVHCTSLDGKVYVGFLPETYDAVVHDVLWRVEVNDGTGSGGWNHTFKSGSPALAVAGVVAALVAAPFSSCVSYG